MKLKKNIKFCHSFSYFILLVLFCLGLAQYSYGQQFIQWTNTFGDSVYDCGYNVQQTLDGGYIVAGWANFNNMDYSEGCLIKTDANGDIIWTKTFGGNAFDWGSSIQQTTDSGYIITGGTGSYGAGESDVWLIKTDASGDTIWTVTFGGDAYDWGSFVQQTTDGGYIITGGTGSFGAGDRDVWLIKTGANPSSIDEVSKKYMTKIYPNPTKDMISIEVENQDNATIEIYNISGKLIFSKELDSKVEKIDVSGLPEGIYVVKVLQNNTVNFGKLVIR